MPIASRLEDRAIDIAAQDVREGGRLAVDDDQRPADAGDDLGGADLGGHAADADVGIGRWRECFDLGRDLFDDGDTSGGRIAAGVGGVQAVDV